MAADVAGASSLSTNHDAWSETSQPVTRSLRWPFSQDVSLNSIDLAERNSLRLYDGPKVRLKVVQQPKAARACGLSEQDRRMIDPPPILQLYLDNAGQDSRYNEVLLKSVFNIVSCGLICISCDNTQFKEQDVSIIQNPYDKSRDLRTLIGSSTISPFITDDLSILSCTSTIGHTGSYYIFSDLSCRYSGRYKSRFSLILIDAVAMTIGSQTPIVDTIDSDEFMVYSARDFPGMQPSSELFRRLKAHGADVSIKYGIGNRVKKGTSN